MGQGSIVARPVPSAYSWSGSLNMRPNMRTNNSGGTVITNTEQFAVISLAASGGFTEVNLPLLPTKFSWISNTALSYSKFRFRRVRVWYLPAVGTTTAGRIAMSQSSDYADNSPTSCASIIVGSGSAFGPVYGGGGGFSMSNPFGNSQLLHTDFDMGKSGKPWYPVISASVFDSLLFADKNIYSPGQVFVGTDSGTAAVVCGELYISYEIEFADPIAPAVQ